LGEKHFSCAEEVADHTHAVHQRPFDDVERTRIFRGVCASFLGVGFDELIDAFDQRVAQSSLDREISPRVGG
jgi:hypothetical protein